MERKQKVLIVHNFYNIPGGEDTVVYNEKRLLEENGHEVVLYTRRNKELNKMSKFSKIIMPVIMIFNIKTYMEIKKIILEESIDIVHVHNTLVMISPSVYYASYRMRVPVVQTIHNFRLLCPNATFCREGKICEDCVEKGLFNAVRNRCYRNSIIQSLACVLNTRVHRFFRIYEKINYICLTDFNKKKILQLKQIKEDSVFVKSNFVHVSSQKIVPHHQRKRQIIYVGRLDKLKGIDLLLKAWCELSKEDIQLIVCGVGPMEDWCKQFVKERNIQNISFLGFINNNEIRQIIGESLALVLPTQWYEGFPMTIVEAYSVGTPVIGSNLGNVGTVIEDEITGLMFKYDSVEELVLKIKNILQMELEESVYRVYCDKYTEEKNYMVLKEIYDKIKL